MNRVRRLHALAAAASLAASFSVRAQLRILTYNTDAADVGTLNPGFETILPAITAESTNGIARPIDVFSITETITNSNSGSQTTATQSTRELVNILNNGDRNNSTPGKYAQGVLDGTTTGGGTDGIIYNTQTVTLISEIGIGSATSSGAARQPLRYQFRPVGYGPSAYFYVYVDHYKASTGTSNQNRRNVEAATVRADAAGLPAGSRILYTGDFNLTGDESTNPAGPVTAEPAWNTLTTVGTGSLAANNAIDPINLGNGSWNTGNSAFKSAYTISTSSLNARFDFEFNTPTTMDGHGFSYINGSYHVVGNNGTTPLNGSVNSGSNTYGTAALRSAIGTASDHYPLVADYRLPAFLGVSVGAVGSQVITGASVSIPVTIKNAAPVTLSIGADGLDYTYISSGSFSGSGSFTGLQAATAGNTHIVAVNTSTPGVATGTINVTSSSQEVGGAPFVGSFSTSVLSHAHPSFASTASNSLTIGFGTRAADSAALGLGTPTANFSIHNLADAAGASLTAGLDLDSIVGNGDTSVLTTNLAPFTNLAAPNVQNFTATLAGTGYGSCSATYTLNLSDQNLPGAQATGPLTLTLIGRLAMAGDSNVDGSVNALDFNTLASNFGQAVQGWENSDFNADGVVDTVDFTALAQNFGQTYNPNPAPPLGSIVPEPGMLVTLLAIGALGAYRRKRL